MPHVERPHRGRHLFAGPLPLGGRAVAVLVAFLTLVILLLLLVQDAKGNFVYWANNDGTSIGRAKINGTGVNNSFIPGLSNVHGVAIDSQHIYWTHGDGSASSIGRANLDGSAANPNFIPNSPALTFAPINPVAATAVTTSAIYWVNTGSGSTIGRANIDGGSPNGGIVNIGGDPICGIAADQNFIYWLDVGLGQTIGRASPDGSGVTFNFVPAVTGSCGLAADPSFLYWGATGGGVGRAPITGGSGSANNAFIPNASSAGNSTCGVGVNSQYLFWGNTGIAGNFVGRANVNGSSANPNLIAGATSPCMMQPAPSNKITINSVKKKKKKGTATINAKVPGPGQVTLNQTSAPPDANATEAAVKQAGLTITQASSFNLAVKPVGKTAKKLNKQIKKQLKKKRKAKAKANVTVFIHFVPAGVAGVPNTERLKVTLIKQRKKKR